MDIEWSVSLKPNGDEIWYKGGDIHNEDGPAIKRADGSMEWWRNGELHNEDGPAVISEDEETWVVNGLLHRIWGPAQTSKKFNTRVWAVYGTVHRDDGPAVEYNERSDWYIYGEKVTEEIHNLYRRNRRRLAFKYFHMWYDCLDDLSRPVGQRRMRECIDKILD